MSEPWAAVADAFVARVTPEPEREMPTDPVEWVRDELDEHVWSKQREIMRSVLTHRRTMVPSCHEAGKSHIASRVAAYWLAAHPLGTAQAMSSAPSENQVKAILWQHIARAKRRAGLPGDIRGLTGSGPVQWYVGEELVAQGRKPPERIDDEQAMQMFQGMHAEHMLIVLDEATGVPGWLWEAAESLIANEGGRMLAIGNPDDPSSTFADYCKRPDLCNVVAISAFDTPNFTGEPVPAALRNVLIGQTYVADMEARVGTDSPIYVSKVLGQFPDESDDSVIGSGLIRRAHALELPGDVPGAFGLDVARFGQDRTVLYRSRGGVVRLIDEWGKQPVTASADRARAHQAPTPLVPVVIDADGIGGGVLDIFRANGWRAAEFTMAAAPRQPRRFDSRRSEMWWTMREALQDGQVDLDPSDDVLAAQLMQPKWWLDNRGRIHVETKKEMAKRGKGSPDHADAAIMAEFGTVPIGKGRPPQSLQELAPVGRSETADLLHRRF